jgi:transposase
LRCKFILVLDRWGVHRKAVRDIQRKHPGWFDVEWLPAYAPELNPTEFVWTHNKCCDLANFIPDNVRVLETAVKTSLRRQKRRPNLLRASFKHAKLIL